MDAYKEEDSAGAYTVKEVYSYRRRLIRRLRGIYLRLIIAVAGSARAGRGS